MSGRHIQGDAQPSLQGDYEVSHRTLRAFHYAAPAMMQGAKAEIAAKVVREIGLRLSSSTTWV
jgi:excinuclease ABC subunit A